LDEGKAEASDRAATPGQSGPADPAAYVQEFWDGPLRTGEASTDIAQLWNAFDADATGARSQYGRQAGLGGAWFFCLRGQGTVETVEKDRVVLTATDSSRRVCLKLGVVVDNTVREAIGVKASEFANSQDFNAVSSELNRRAEQEVIASSRALLKAGVVVDFVGCAKISGKSDLDPLCLIPIRLRTRGSEDANAGLDKDTATGTTP
jgi:predicted lipoprotein